MISPSALSTLTDADKDALIVLLWTQVQALTARAAELEAKLKEPAKTSDNSGVPPSKGAKANRPDQPKREGPRQGSLGRKGGGCALAKAAACVHCHGPLWDADQKLHARYDKIDLPPVRPVVTRVERYLGHCPCGGGATVAPVPDGMEQDTPFSVSILALAL